MIIFKKLRYKNFLSAGNQFTEIDFLKNKMTLVVGKNGAGKTTFIDAICFALYNKGFRNVNKPALVNSITQKNTLTEVEFSINDNEYHVKRGINPPVFEIFKNGTLIDQTNTKDYQDELEKRILKMTYKTFVQIVVLGSANYIPFMQLTPDVRREIQEELLDLKIYSVMNSLLKKKIDSNKSNVRETDYQLTILKNKIELQDSHIQQLKQNNEELIDEKVRKIEEITSAADLYRSEKKTAQEVHADLNSKLSARKKKTKKIQEYEALDQKLATKAGKLKKDIKFYEETSECPSCLQCIDKSHSLSIIGQKKASLQEVENARSELAQRISNISQGLPNLEELNEGIIRANKSIAQLDTQIATSKALIIQYEQEIEDLKKRNTDIDDQNDKRVELQAEYDKLSEIQAKYSEEKEIFVAASSLLKDGGIKNKIISQYISLINQIINEFLSKMEFFINFQFDDGFNEHIKSRFRDEFSYGSFSQGEKMRINLAILFTWREIAKRRNSASCNLLIFDEVLDGSLDIDGAEEFMKIVQNILKDVNVFIISHKDTFQDKFENVIRFTKVKNFSRIAA